jgi:hypothetical protein
VWRPVTFFAELSDLRGPLSDKVSTFTLLANLYRYLPQFCTAWAMIQVFGMLSSLVAANGMHLYESTAEMCLHYVALLALRLVALLRRNQAMVWFIRGFFFVSYAVTATVMVQAMVTYSGQRVVLTDLYRFLTRNR